MSVRRLDNVVDSKYLWQPVDGIESNSDAKLEDTYLCFGIFWLDIYADYQHQLEELQKHQVRIEQSLNDWNIHYPWSNIEGVAMEIRFLSEDKGKRPYLFGYHCVEDNIEAEEGIVVSLLFEYLKESGPEVFMKICDTDGDFLIDKFEDLMPDVYAFPSANNRLWLHEGKFKAIPASFKPGRGIESSECIEFLSKQMFKCEVLTKMQDAFEKEILNSFPHSYLDELKLIKLAIPDDMCHSGLKLNPGLGSYLIKQSLENTDTAGGSVATIVEQAKQSPTTYDLLVPASHLRILSTVQFNVTGKEKDCYDPHICGWILCNTFSRLIKTGKILYKPNSKRLTDPDSIFANFPFKEVRKIKEVEKIFADMNENLYGAQTFNNKTKSKLAAKDYEVSKDDEARKYFKSENVDIDEDDFFEYFLTEALGVSKKELDEYTTSNISNGLKEDGIPQTDDIGDDCDLEMSDEILQKLLESFKMGNMQ
ncbi:SGT1 protein [Nakaseomyces glabratus]